MSLLDPSWQPNFCFFLLSPSSSSLHKHDDVNRVIVDIERKLAIIEDRIKSSNNDHDISQAISSFEKRLQFLDNQIKNNEILYNVIVIQHHASENQDLMI